MDRSHCRLRAEHVAELLSLGRATVYLMMAAGDIPVVHSDRAARVPAQALRAWVAERTQTVNQEVSQ